MKNAPIVNAMIIPTLCISCGRPCAHQWFDYVDRVKAHREAGIATPEEHALDDMKITRACCRNMFLCNIDLSLVISPL